jgi:hypothetical protein
MAVRKPRYWMTRTNRSGLDIVEAFEEELEEEHVDEERAERR